MNTRNLFKTYTLTLCLLLLCASASAPARAQSKQKEKPGAAQSSATPSEVVRAYYTALREGRVRDAMLMSVLRPAVEGLSAAELADIAERLARGVASMPFRIGDSDLSITVSVGAAIADGSPAAHVWRNAQTALARAKAAGGGQIELFRTGDDTGTSGAGQAEMFGTGDATGTGETEQTPAEAAASQQSGAA